MKSETHKTMNVIVTIFFVLIASAAAILSKALLPSSVNVEDFNSIFVKTLGFPIIASLYFILIYSHNAIVTKLWGKQSKLSKLEIGLRFGICFAIIYLLGMQEVIVEASPFSSWGIEYVIYQFFMGIGEAFIALILCLAISEFTIRAPKQEIQSNRLHNKIALIILVILAFTIERAIGYETSFITSNVDKYPIPTYAWTILFGFALGFCFIMLYPVFSDEKGDIKVCSKITIVAIGFSWIIFNSFIGLIFEGAMVDALLRSVLDIMALFLSSLLWQKYFNKIRT